MIRIEVDLDGARKFLTDFISNIGKSGKEVLGDTVSEIIGLMQEEGKPVTYPIKWDSDRQRKAFFASDGFGGGIPHVRTGAYVQGWQKTELPDGYQMSNKSPAGAIGGTIKGTLSGDAIGGVSLQSWQSKIHRGRWRSILPTVLDKVANLPRRIIDKMKLRTE